MPCAADIPLRIDIVEGDHSIVLAVEGELDIATCPVLDDALGRARATDAATIVVDLLKISFIDSTGLHVLIKHARAEDGPPRIRVTKVSPQVERVFKLSGVLECLPFDPDWASGMDR